MGHWQLKLNPRDAAMKLDSSEFVYLGLCIETLLYGTTVLSLPRWQAFTTFSLKKNHHILRTIFWHIHHVPTIPSIQKGDR